MQPLKTYHPANCQARLDHYDNGALSSDSGMLESHVSSPMLSQEVNDFLQNLTQRQSMEKPLMVRILDTMAPQGQTDVIHAPEIAYTIEGRRTRLPTFELFFITQHENKTHFFVYCFSGSSTHEFTPQSIARISELSSDDFFKKLMTQSELKALHDSFVNHLGLLNLRSRLNENLDIGTTTRPSAKI